MVLKMIEKKVNSLTKDDVVKMARDENITLNDNEVDIIYKYVKNDWRTLIYGDSNIIFSQLKNQINPNAYDKIKALFDFYRDKYKNYL